MISNELNPLAVLEMMTYQVNQRATEWSCLAGVIRTRKAIVQSILHITLLNRGPIFSFLKNPLDSS